MPSDNSARKDEMPDVVTRRFVVSADFEGEDERVPLGSEAMPWYAERIREAIGEAGVCDGNLKVEPIYAVGESRKDEIAKRYAYKLMEELPEHATDEAYADVEALFKQALTSYEEERTPSGEGWQPPQSMETAPRDATPILGFEKNEKTPQVMRWAGMCWTSIPGGYTCHPILWWPMPKMPPLPPHAGKERRR